MELRIRVFFVHITSFSVIFYSVAGTLENSLVSREDKELVGLQFRPSLRIGNHNSTEEIETSQLPWSFNHQKDHLVYVHKNRNYWDGCIRGYDGDVLILYEMCADYARRIMCQYPSYETRSVKICRGQPECMPYKINNALGYSQAMCFRQLGCTFLSCGRDNLRQIRSSSSEDKSSSETDANVLERRKRKKKKKLSDTSKDESLEAKKSHKRKRKRKQESLPSEIDTLPSQPRFLENIQHLAVISDQSQNPPQLPHYYPYPPNYPVSNFYHPYGGIPGIDSEMILGESRVMPGISGGAQNLIASGIMNNHWGSDNAARKLSAPLLNRPKKEKFKKNCFNYPDKDICVSGPDKLSNDVPEHTYEPEINKKRKNIERSKGRERYEEERLF